MKQVLFFICLLFVITVNSQDTIRIKHTNYTTVFSVSKHYPVLVEWWATRAKVGCPTPLARKDKFAPDPLLKEDSDIADDYKGSGFDRGHMSPAADNQCQTQDVQDECFYFTNMAAQYHSLNAGDWKSLETLTRSLAIQKDSVKVWAGNIGVLKRIGRVAVPRQCWKVIYVVKDKQYFAYIFDNTSERPEGLHVHEIALYDMKQLTHFDFKL